MTSGVKMTIDVHSLDDALVRLGRFMDFDAAPVMESIGALGESQTRRRITDEKTAPDGTPWKPNRTNTSILYATGENLAGSLAFTADANEAVWGASWERAHIHQEGAVIKPDTAKALRFQGPKGAVFAKKVTIPARPFVGLSDDNREEIADLVTDVFGHMLQGIGR